MDNFVNRSFHAWFYRETTDDYKCFLCGGVVKELPVDVNRGIADSYEPLNEKERDILCQYRHCKRIKQNVIRTQ